MSKIELNLTKLFGFKIVSNKNNVQLPVTLGSKLGGKIGSKIGSKVGRKA